jgi:hypothetical protein
MPTHHRSRSWRGLAIGAARRNNAEVRPARQGPHHRITGTSEAESLGAGTLLIRPVFDLSDQRRHSRRL